MNIKLFVLIKIIFLLSLACSTATSDFRTEDVYLGSRIPAYKLDIVSTKTVSSGALTTPQVIETLALRKKMFDYCYEDALLKDNDLQGQGVWNFSTNKKGIITGFKFEVDSSTVAEGFLQQCIGHHLIRTKYPASIKGDSDVTVHFLFSILKN